MAGDTDGCGQGRWPGGNGHRAVPREDGVRIEVWAGSRENCLAEAVAAVVECFADVSGVRPTGVDRVRLDEAGDDDLPAALLDEVLHRLRVHGLVPVDVETDEAGDGLDVRLAVAALADVRVTGALPTAVTRGEPRIGPGPYGWSGAVTVDGPGAPPAGHAGTPERHRPRR